VTTTFQTPTPGKLLAHDLAIEAAGMVFQLVDKVPVAARDLANQARRAAASVPLNLSEASGRAGRDRLQHHRIAYGSLKETMSCIAILRAIGAVDQSRAEHTLTLLDRIGALTWRLAQPR